MQAPYDLSPPEAAPSFPGVTPARTGVTRYVEVGRRGGCGDVRSARRRLTIWSTLEGMLPPRAWAVALAVLGAAGCAGSAPERSTAPPRAVSSPLAPSTDAVTVPRLIPPTSGGSVSTVDTAADGSRYLVSHGLRVLERPDGSVEVSRDFLPGRRADALKLPERLGGGYVFYATTSGSTSFWRARHWTAPLEPLARIDGEMMRVVPGFDRLYLQRDRRSPWLALDLENPRIVDLSGLPRAPAYGAMAFADEWFGAVEVPFRGLLVTFDAGASYRPTGLKATSVTAKDGELHIESPDALLALGADGNVRPLESPNTTSPKTPSKAAQRPPIPGLFGRRPLELAVLHGVALAPERALIAAGGALAEVSLLDGSLLRVTERAYAGTSPCQGIALGRGVGFVCSEPNGKTSVLAYTAPDRLEEAFTFNTPRYVASNAGALAIRGSCHRDGSPTGRYCIVPREGAPYELPVEGDVGVERVVALTDGRAVVLVPPRFGAKGALAVVGPKGPEKSASLEFPKDLEPTVAGLVKNGFWLHGFEQHNQDSIRGWVTGDGPLVGVRVKLDGKVEVGKLEHSGLERALISGRYALVFGLGGASAESSDGGFTWRAIDLPSTPALGRPRGSLTSPTNGCSAIGCAFGGWLRVGYSSKDDDAPLSETAPPKPLRIPSPGGGRWSIACFSTGETSQPARATPRLDLTARPDDDGSTGPWLPFWEEAPPKLALNEVGYDAGTENELSQMRAYTWGPRGGDWNRQGKWLVRVAERSRIKQAIWSTAVSRAPWGSAEIAADVFGYSPSGGISAFRVVPDASSRSALLSLTSRGRQELYLLEEGRAIVPLRSPGALGSPNSWVKLGQSYFLSTITDSRSFRVYRVNDGELVLFAEYPELQGHFLSSKLVSDTRGESLGLLTRSTSTFVSPIDLVSGEVGAPLEIEPSRFARMPRACNGGEEGWVLSGALPIDPEVAFPGWEEHFALRGFEARLIVSDEDLCVEGLAAYTELPDTPRPTASGRQEGVPLVVSDRGDLGRRVGFRCKN